MSALDSYFNVLVCIARADSRIDKAEQAFILGTAEAYGLSKARQEKIRNLLTSPSFDAEEVLLRAARELDPATFAEVMRDGYILAATDGELADVEVDHLEKLLVLADYPAERRQQLHSWAVHAAQHQLDGIALFGKPAE